MNLRVLGVTEIKTVPFVPLSHPFVERLIGTIRRECLDHLLFWTTADLEMKLSDFQNYYNFHWSLANQTPIPTAESKRVSLKLLRVVETLSRVIPNAKSRVRTNSPCSASSKGWFVQWELVPPR